MHFFICENRLLIFQSHKESENLDLKPLQKTMGPNLYKVKAQSKHRVLPFKRFLVVQDSAVWAARAVIKISVILLMYRIVASRSTSRLVTCLGLFRLLMKGIFGPYDCDLWTKS